MCFDVVFLFNLLQGQTEVLLTAPFDVFLFPLLVAKNNVHFFLKYALQGYEIEEGKWKVALACTVLGVGRS